MTPDRPCTEASQCRSCGAPVLWVEWSKTGKRMPVDVKPNPDGGIVLTHSAKLNKLIAEVFYEPVDGVRNRFVSHFASCGQADAWRKSK